MLKPIYSEAWPPLHLGWPRHSRDHWFSSVFPDPQDHLRPLLHHQHLPKQGFRRYIAHKRPYTLRTQALQLHRSSRHYLPSYHQVSTLINL